MRWKRNGLAKDFHGHLPPDIQTEATVSQKHFNDISTAAERVISSWNKRDKPSAFANVRKYIRKVGSTISNHSNVLKILLSSNDYDSVFCGARKVFIAV